MADFKQRPEATEPGVGKRRTQLSFVSRYSQLQPWTGGNRSEERDASGGLFSSYRRRHGLEQREKPPTGRREGGPAEENEQ